MDFSEKLHELAARFQDFKPHLTNEESTKTALVLPFFQALGYDVTDPRVVHPEYTADIGTKQGEKVDFAIMKDGVPIMLIECKPCGCPLDQSRASQLHRYFHNTSARIAILTDGLKYLFFSDLDSINKMDPAPFMVFDFEAIEEALVAELKKLRNDKFNVERALSAATNLKYTRALKQVIREEFENPSDDFIRLFVGGRVYTGQMRQHIVEEFRPRLKQAVEHYINEVLNARLDSAKTKSEYPAGEPEEDEASSEKPGRSGVVTTEEEMQAYYMVKAILSETVAPERVVMRDAKSYCNVLLDDNNRKPLCRFRFNTSQKYLSIIMDADKNEERIPLDRLDDIFRHAEKIKAVPTYYPV